MGEVNKKLVMWRTQVNICVGVWGAPQQAKRSRRRRWSGDWDIRKGYPNPLLAQDRYLSLSRHCARQSFVRHNFLY